MPRMRPHSAESASMRRFKSTFRSSSSLDAGLAVRPTRRRAAGRSPAGAPRAHGRNRSNFKVRTQSSAEWAGPSAWARDAGHLTGESRSFRRSSKADGKLAVGDVVAARARFPGPLPTASCLQILVFQLLQREPDASSASCTSAHSRPRSAGFSGPAGASTRSGTLVLRAPAALRISARTTSSVIRACAPAGPRTGPGRRHPESGRRPPASRAETSGGPRRVVRSCPAAACRSRNCEIGHRLRRSRSR